MHHKVPLITPAMTTVLPHVRVDCNIGIDQGVVEPFLAMPPIQIQKLDEEPVWNWPWRDTESTVSSEIKHSVTGPETKTERQTIKHTTFECLQRVHIYSLQRVVRLPGGVRLLTHPATTCRM